MRRDLVVDGVSFGSSTIEGNDATDNIVSMWKNLDCNDIGCIFLDGLVVSMYNIIDGRSLCEITGLPVVAITFRDSKGLERSIRYHFCSTKVRIELGDIICLETENLYYLKLERKFLYDIGVHHMK